MAQATPINQAAVVRGMELLKTFKAATGNDELQMQAMAVFLYVAYRHPNPVPQVEIEKNVGLTQTTTSRNVGYWAKGAAKMEKGYGMFAVEEDPYYRKRKLITLTPKGQALAGKVSSTLAF
jgi:DNA-binding MarR family transcriptional regulator